MKYKNHSNHKKISTNQDKAKKITLWMSLFIAFIMITSAFGVIFYGYNSPDDTVKYGKLKFNYDYTTGNYIAKINGKLHHFSVTPIHVENISKNSDVKIAINTASEIILTSNESSSYNQDIALAYYYLQQTADAQNIPLGTAFTTKINELPAVTCKNATVGSSVILFEESNQTELVKQKDCIIVKFASGSELQLLTAKLQYFMLGVLNE